MSDITEYQELADSTFNTHRPKSAQDDTFHSVYIAGQSRETEIGGMSEKDKLQIRGVQNNLEELHMIILHTKQIYMKESHGPSGQHIDCFSYCSGEYPWLGTSLDPETQQARQCGNATERATNEFCKACRANLIVSGIYCNSKGQPIKDENGKPTFVFIRGKGMKYSNVSEYLVKLSELEFDEPFFTPATEDTKAFEKRVVNSKRVVTKITVTSAESKSYGSFPVFELNNIVEIPIKNIETLLNISKDMQSEFIEKFDWSKRQKSSQAFGYGEGVKEENKFDESNQSESKDNSDTINDTELLDIDW